jgi:hypothetical protein
LAFSAGAARTSAASLGGPPGLNCGGEGAGSGRSGDPSNFTEFLDKP